MQAQENPGEWDEFQWEKFLRMQERRHETAMLYALRSRNPWRFGAFWSGVQSEPLPEEEESWNSETEGDEWKITLHPCYRAVTDSLDTIQRSLDSISPEDRSRAAVVELIARSYSIPSLIATGLALLFEYGCTGGALAHCKRALYLANGALDCLNELRKDAVFSRIEYGLLIREGTNIRNTIGCYISDLRFSNSKPPIA